MLGRLLPGTCQGAFTLSSLLRNEQAKRVPGPFDTARHRPASLCRKRDDGRPNAATTKTGHSNLSRSCSQGWRRSVESSAGDCENTTRPATGIPARPSREPRRLQPHRPVCIYILRRSDPLAVTGGRPQAAVGRANRLRRHDLTHNGARSRSRRCENRCAGYGQQHALLHGRADYLGSAPLSYPSLVPRRAQGTFPNTGPCERTGLGQSERQRSR